VISVTKAYLPSKEKYKAYIDRIYESGWLTNNGELLQELEKRLAEYLGVRNIICVANGSLALQLAYKALDLKGEVITTPFSFPATTSTLVWEGLKPVFADIYPTSFNLDPKNIEQLITDKTSAIVPVHVFGNPCQVEVIHTVAEKYNLKIIYDAAHAFDTQYTDKAGKTQSLLNYGDISTISFHATKLFHTIEGGAVITNDDELAKKIRLLINFGITSDPTIIESVGTNAKMNEFEAAMGLCILDEIDSIKAERKRIWQIYSQELIGWLDFQQWNPQSKNNYSYAPVLFETEDKLLEVEAKLKENNIFPRRYFYPSLDKLDFSKTDVIASKARRSLQNTKIKMNHSHDIASRVLCLPMYPGLSERKQNFIIKCIGDMF